MEIIEKSKKLSEIREGDTIYFNGKPMTVDKHYLFHDHGEMNEMIIEVFNPENEREYQVRYFDDQQDTSIEVYYLEGDFQYVKKEPKTISW